MTTETRQPTAPLDSGFRRNDDMSGGDDGVSARNDGAADGIRDAADPYGS